MPVRACKTAIYQSASALALCFGAHGVAAAQAVDPAAPDAVEASEAEQSENEGLQDIVVTASRRAVNLQKESRDISVLSGEQLTRQGITEPDAIQALVPGLTIARSGSQLQVSIRGVGDRSVSSQTDPAVALNVDGVYFPRSYAASNFFYDLDRVEVLKGPQGTLYGRNASAGALNIIVTKPKFETSGYIEGQIGNYDLKGVTAALNTTISDTVAVRVAGQWVDRDGYLTGGFNDDEHHSVRFQVLIAPTDATSILLSSAYSHRGGVGQGAVLARGQLSRGAITDATYPDFVGTSALPLPSNRWAGPTDPRTLAYLDATNPGSARVVRRTGDLSYVDLDVYTLSATFEHKFDWATLTLIPSYVGSRLNELNLAALAIANQEVAKSDHFAFEGRLSSPASSRLKWVVGGFAALEDLSDDRQALIPVTPTEAINSIVVQPKLNDRTWAVFGEVNASVTDTFRLIGGLRYTWERKNAVGTIGTCCIVGFGPFGPIFADPSDFPQDPSDPDYPAGLPVDGKRTDKAFNFRAGVEYDVGLQSMLYASVSSGFKAGGFFSYRAPDNTYRPEKLLSFQAGAKNRFFDNRLQLNIEGFYWKYKDKQETFLSQFADYGNIINIANAGRVTSYGGDVSLVARITSADTITGEVAYLHSNYDRFVYNFGGAADPTINCPSTTNNAGFPPITTVDCSGKSLIRAPSWTGRATYERVQSLGDMGQLIFNAQMRFSSSYWLSNNFTKATRAEAFQTYDASLTWEAPSRKLAVTGFINNIGNTAVYTAAVQSSAIANATAAQIEAPRTYGVRARVSF